MLAYSTQDLILEPFAGTVFGFTPPKAPVAAQSVGGGGSGMLGAFGGAIGGPAGAGVTIGVLALLAGFKNWQASRNLAALKSWQHLGRNVVGSVGCIKQGLGARCNMALTVQ